MSVTAKDFIAEAQDIAEFLTPNIPSVDLATYVQQRCATLYAANALFDRDKFTNMAFGLTGASVYDEIRGYGYSRAAAHEHLLVLRSVLDQHRVIPSRCEIGRDPNAEESKAFTYFLQWRGSSMLSTSMHDTHATLKAVRRG